MISKNKNFKFKSWTQEITNRYTKSRDGETKIGEEFCSLDTAEYVILGIEESIGPEANLGRPGAENGFEAFCNSFFNMQSNRFLTGCNTAFLGRIYVSDVFHEPEYRKAVSELDEFVNEVLVKYMAKDQMLIVVGGGHNNAYPLIRFASEKKSNKVNVVNLDAHADYRPLEGRHSGNPFSYAFKEGYLNKYTVIGLHKAYNSEDSLNRLDEDGHAYAFMEEFVDGEKDWSTYLQTVKEEFKKDENGLGLELDLDAIQMMPASACSPFGFSLGQAREYVRSFAALENTSYFHLPEGAPCNESEKIQVGKALAFLVSDFISVNSKK